MLRLHKQVDRIIDGLANQRRAETKRNAVHRAETQADGGDAGQCAADHRQKAQGQRSEGAIDQQQ